MVDLVKQEQAEDEQEQSYDTSDKEQVNQARKKAARTRKDRLEFVKAAMQHEQGRAWFFDLLLRCHVVRNPFMNDPYATAFRCGEQNVGLMVLSDIQAIAPEEYIWMMNENRRKA